MKTTVETFVIEETAELIYDDGKLSEWNEMVADLGLAGQSKIVKPQKSPIPYMPINDILKNVFETLCPRKVDIKEYDVTPIPVEILSLVRLSNREHHFQKIEIWYDDKEKDPLCVGVSGEFVPVGKGYTWFHDNKQKSSEDALAWLSSQGIEPYNKDGGYLINEKYYLIGRWADVKRTFKELAEMARERFISSRKNTLMKEINERQRELDDLELDANLKFSASSVNEFPF